MTSEIRLPDEKSDRSVEEATYADRLDTLEGKQIAYVDWGKPNGDRLYKSLQALLVDDFDIESLDYYEKPTPSSPIPSATQAEIIESGSDAVILAIADCGSCNSSIVVDAITFEEENVPTVQIITDKFLNLNDTISESRGYEKLPLITLDHPTRYLDADEVRSVAEDIKWTIQQLLTCEECLFGLES